jgi:hypothetical protein
VTAVPNVQDLDRSHPERTRVLLALIPLLGVTGVALGLAFGLSGTDLALLALALATGCLASLPLVLDQGRRPSERHIILSTFSVLFVISFVAPVFAIYLPGDWPMDAPSYGFSNLFPRDVIRAQLTTILAFVSLLIGYALGRRCAAPIPRMRRDWSLRATLAVACLMIPFGWAVLLAGMFGLLAAAWGSGVLSVLGSSYTYGIALLAIAALRYRSRTSLALIAVVVPVTSIFGVLMGSKTAILIAGAMVVLAIIVVRRRISVRWVLVGILAFPLVYPVMRFVREDILRFNTLTAVDALRRPSDTLERIFAFVSSNRPSDYFLEGLMLSVGRFDGLGAVSVIVRDTPGVVPFQYGRTLALFFVSFVPRVLWPDKPTITTGEYITNVYGSGPDIESSTAATQIGDFFMNFGYPGVIGGMILYGILLRIGHEVLLRGRPTTPALFVAVVVLRELALNFEGNVATVWAVTVTSIMPILAAHLAVRTFSRTISESDGSNFAPRVDAEAGSS